MFIVREIIMYHVVHDYEVEDCSSTSDILRHSMAVFPSREEAEVYVNYENANAEAFQAYCEAIEAQE